MEEIQQLVSTIGVPSIVVILILREILPVIKGKDKNGSAAVSRGEFEEHKKSIRYADTCREIHQGLNTRMDDFKEDLSEIKRLIRNGNK